MSLAAAVVTDESTPKTRGKGMAMIGIAFSVGFIVGPVIGAAFSAWGKGGGAGKDWFFYPASFALTLACLQFAYLYFNFKETLPEKQRLKSLGEALKQVRIGSNCNSVPFSIFIFKSHRPPSTSTRCTCSSTPAWSSPSPF